MLSHFDDIMLGLLNGHDTEVIWIPSTTYKVDNFLSQRPSSGSRDEWQAFIHSKNNQWRSPRDRFRPSIIYSFHQRYEIKCKKLTSAFFR